MDIFGDVHNDITSDLSYSFWYCSTTNWLGGMKEKLEAQLRNTPVSSESSSSEKKPTR